MTNQRPQGLAGAVTASSSSTTTTKTTTPSLTSTPSKNNKHHHLQLNHAIVSANPTSQQQHHPRITRSRAKKTKHNSPQVSMNNSSLEYFTNTQFSRSFNSLILDDSKDEIGKKTINKSPPFNVKQDLYSADGIDTYLDDVITDDDLENDEEDDDFMIEQGQQYDDDPSLNISKSKRITNEYIPTPPRHNQEDTSKTSGSSMKRSSKFFNLSIDSTISVKSTPRIHTISPNTQPQIEIDSIDVETPSLGFREGTPSPRATRTPIENNQFKRPHKLVSQSPSPSSSRTFTAHPSSTSLFSANEEIRQSSDSPSKLKGFKMFKNANKDAIMSPHRPVRISTPEKLRFSFDKSKTTKLRKTIQSPYTTHSPITSTPLLTAVPVGVETAEIPCQPSQNFENYDDDLDFDSPSKTRKSSGLSMISSNSATIYQEQPLKHLSSPNHILPQPIEVHTIQPSSELNPRLFDDKENRLPSYKFVKPLQAAFNSSGLIKKNNVKHIPDRKLPPETPIKRNPLMLLNTNHKTISGKRASSFTIIEEEHTDNSIEVGRNQSYDASAHSTLNNSSFFRIPQTTQIDHVIHHDFDIELNDIDMTSVPETPTKSHSQANKSFNKINYTPPLTRCKNSLVVNVANDNGNGDHEPSTPTNLQFFKSNAGKQTGKHNLHHETTIDEDDTTTLQYHPQELTQTEDLYVDEKMPQLPAPSKIDDHLIEKFGMKNVKTIGIGEFSIAYECIIQDQKLAIKRSKRPVSGKLERKAIQREIDALRALTSVSEDGASEEEGKEYLVYFIEAWDFNHYYYIMTEFCEGGTLFDFLEENKHYRIDEFRIWKILIEILSGLRFIHSKNYLHLDLKPANIFITFEGSLKIGDFGLATKLPILEKDFDLEGDRNYIAPELINDKIYTPFADIFCLGLIILEIAANIILPDNGTPWRKLRSGDLSDAGQLSSDNISIFLHHHASSAGGCGGESNHCLSSSTTNISSTHSLTINSSASNLFTMPPQNPVNNSTTQLNSPATAITSGTPATTGSSSGMSNKASARDLIPPWAPEFLTSGDSMNLDRLVNKMLRPNPFDRPSASVILEMEECVIIENRRKAGATIFEGEFGPPDD